MPAKGSSIVGTAKYIQERVRMMENGCVEWTSTLCLDGYGKAVVGYKGNARPIRRPAHRVTYEMWKGAVAVGLDLDHLCRNRRCVNPDHLEPVTRKENVRRGLLPSLMLDPAFKPMRKKIAVCKNGHEMIGDNVGTSERQKRRWCRSCKRDQMKRKKTKMKVQFQGDICFVEIDAIPEGAKAMAKRDANGDYILAESETQHHHVIRADGCVAFDAPSDPNVCYLQMGSHDCDVVHHRAWDTHAPTTLKANKIYMGVRQVERAPSGWQRVAD